MANYCGTCGSVRSYSARARSPRLTVEIPWYGWLVLTVVAAAAAWWLLQEMFPFEFAQWRQQRFLEGLIHGR